MAELRATPQSPALGAIANLLKQAYAPQRTQQMQGVAEFLGIPAVARTVERMSYGQPVTNLKKANVPLLPEDTAEAAMLVAPPLASMTRRVGTNLVQTAPYVARDIAQSMSSPLRSYVVKPKGGKTTAKSLVDMVEQYDTKPSVDLGRRFFFRMAQPPDQLPAVVKPVTPTATPGVSPLKRVEDEARPVAQALDEGVGQAVDALAQAPVTRRTILQGILSQVMQRFLPKGASPLQALAEEITQPVAQTTAPVSYALSPELRAAVYNMPRASVDVNWGRGINLLDRKKAAETLLKYGDKDLIGEGLSLKHALRQMKSEPEVYASFKKTLEDLASHGRVPLSSGYSGPVSKSEYLSGLTDYGYSPGVIGRESRVWDAANGRFKEARMPGEDSPFPMFDPARSAYGYGFEEFGEIYPEFADLLKGMTTKEAKNAWVNYARSPEGKAAFKALKDYRDAEADLIEQTAKANGLRVPQRSFFDDNLSLRKYYEKSFNDAGLEMPVYQPSEVNSISRGIKEGSLSKIEKPEVKPENLLDAGNIGVDLGNNYAAGGLVKGAVKNIGDLVRKYITKEAPEAAVEENIKAAPKEHKMLQGFYRGYAGDYDAARAAAQDSGVFVSPQRAVGDYYAIKRAKQTGLDPHLEMILADPFAGRGYGHSTMGTGKNPPMTTRAREFAPENVKGRTQLYAKGGAVEASAYDSARVDEIVNQIREGIYG